MIKNLAAKLSTSVDINAVRRAVVSDEFKNSETKRALIMLAQFPFLIIGRIAGVVSDFVKMDVEVTNVSDLDNETLRIHIDDIEVFYIEQDGREIPDIRVDRYD